MYTNSYLQSAQSIIAAYSGSIPFAAWLKQHFKAHKKFGSRDRRIVSQLCYAYFRLGRSFAALSMEEKMRTALFLTSTEASPFFAETHPAWNEQIHLSVAEKLAWLQAEEEWVNIFPLADNISGEIETKAFALSHLVQPLLFLRLRPGKKAKVLAQLQEAGLEVEQRTDTCLALPNSSRATEVLMMNRDAVVQDASSQQVLDLLPAHLLQQPIRAWDCCAASGGKSLLLHDKNRQAQLAVSDVRESILVNLKKRFAEAGVAVHKMVVADVANPEAYLPFEKAGFDLVICDAPCSGSGTWGRTPEQLSLFTADKLAHYSRLQKSIAANAAAYVQQGGYFLYITCSVYRAENEEVVNCLQTETALQLVSMQYYPGFRQQADTLFAALFTV